MLNYPPAQLDHVFHALADPVRRGMVDRLSRAPATVSELAEPLDMSLPGVLQHLRVLEASGIVRSEKVGRVRTCRLDHGVLRSAEEWVAERRSRWAADLDRLEAFLVEVDEEPDDASASPYAEPQSGSST